VRDCAITDLGAAGVVLSTWVWDAANGRDGLRGGRDLACIGNTIDGVKLD